MGALIWLASYPKSGNTWARSFIHNLLKNPSSPIPINELDSFCLGESHLPFYERQMGRALKRGDEGELAKIRPLVHGQFTQVSPDSVFVKTHNLLGSWHGVPIHNMGVTAAAIYIVRNPLDVVLSLASHFSLSIDDAIAHMANEKAATDFTESHIPELHGSWSVHVKSWTANPHQQLCVLRYEDMLAKPYGMFKNLTKFLGLPASKKRIEKAVRFSSFKQLQGQEEKGGFKENPDSAKALFFRSGKSGQWREKLEGAQVEKICAEHGEQMKRFGYLDEGGKPVL
ncbi:MAG: sulfotransferase domain-containing protein [Parvibaculales bacterium]